MRPVLLELGIQLDIVVLLDLAVCSGVGRCDPCHHGRVNGEGCVGDGNVGFGNEASVAASGR